MTADQARAFGMVSLIRQRPHHFGNPFLLEAGSRPEGNHILLVDSGGGQRHIRETHGQRYPISQGRADSVKSAAFTRW